VASLNAIVEWYCDDFLPDLICIITAVLVCTRGNVFCDFDFSSRASGLF
jgi:hypothetical protein